MIGRKTGSLLILLLTVLAACSHKPVPPPVPLPQAESTLSWNRNTEPDLDVYVVHACWTKDCDDFTAVGTVRQPLTGKPEFQVYLAGNVGVLAVTARNTAGKMSGFSDSLAFDRR